jgi:hypothetical protein
MTLLLGCLCSMGISFLLVRHMTRNLVIVERVNPETIQGAELLRSNANKLSDLTQDFLGHFPEGQVAPVPMVEAWLERDFKPRAYSLVKDIEWESSLPGGNAVVHSQAFSDVLEAARRLYVSARHPDDAELRRLAVEDVRRALDVAETHISELKIGRYLTESPHKLRK